MTLCTCIISVWSGIPEIAYIGDDQGAEAKWTEFMQDIELEYEHRGDIAEIDGSVTSEHDSDVNTRNSWGAGYFAFHKTEFWMVQYDLGDQDLGVIYQVDVPALKRLTQGEVGA